MARMLLPLTAFTFAAVFAVFAELALLAVFALLAVLAAFADGTGPSVLSLMSAPVRLLSCIVAVSANGSVPDLLRL